MLDLTEQVYNYLYYEKDLEVDEVYQVYQGNASSIFAEIRIFHPSGSYEEKDVVVEIYGDNFRVLQTDDTQKFFVEMVNDSNF